MSITLVKVICIIGGLGGLGTFISFINASICGIDGSDFVLHVVAGFVIALVTLSLLCGVFLASLMNLL